MDDEREELVEDIGAYVRNEDDSVPELDELPARWDSMTDSPERDLLVAAYVSASRKKRSAWDGLIKLLRVLLARNEAIPEGLKFWACAVVAGPEKPPLAVRNPDFANKDSRNQRIAEMYGYLIHKGRSHDDTNELIEEALVNDLDTSTIRKIIRKLRLRDRFRENNPGQL